MKKKTKELIKWAMGLIDDYRVQNMVEHSNFRKNTPAAQNSEIEIKNCKDFAEFLNTLPKIESHLCRGGYIQDRNGTPCCHGDKIRFEFKDKDYNENFSNRFERITEGELVFCEETKSFQILFGAGDWTDWTTEDYGCKWFEKVK